MRQPLRPRSEDKRIFKYLVPSTNRRRADDQDPECRLQSAGCRGFVVKGSKLTKLATPTRHRPRSHTDTHTHTHTYTRTPLFSPHTSVFTFHSLFLGFYWDFSFFFFFLLACETANGNELFSKVFTRKLVSSEG